MADFAALRRELTTWAGGLPVLLCLLGILGMTWANVPFSDRYHAAASFLRLLAIPVLFIQFRRSERGPTVVLAFGVSCLLLLAASYFLAAFPNVRGPTHLEYGTPVKSYISQSIEFMLCIFALAYVGADAWKAGDARVMRATGIIIALFIFSLLFVASSRTALLLIPVLLLILAWRQFGMEGVRYALACAVLVLAITL
ncbi:MAG: ligase, partial [Pseudolabrys sp.]|nr:ligase [Pseudolabrys sp.]